MLRRRCISRWIVISTSGRLCDKTMATFVVNALVSNASQWHPRGAYVPSTPRKTVWRTSASGRHQPPPHSTTRLTFVAVRFLLEYLTVIPTRWNSKNSMDAGICVATMGIFANPKIDCKAFISIWVNNICYLTFQLLPSDGLRKSLNRSQSSIQLCFQESPQDILSILATSCILPKWHSCKILCKA